MFISSGSHRGFKRLAGIVGVAVASLVLGSTAQAQLLLYENHQGGRYQYNGTGTLFVGLIDVAEPIQVQAITGWIGGGTGTAVAAITLPYIEDQPSHDYHAEFEVKRTPMPPVGELAYPAMWQGVSNLHWNLLPGTYPVGFEGVNTLLSMPYALGYFGPVADVLHPYHLARYQDGEFIEAMPFGIRIYGRPLSAVPEPEFYGWGAVLVLSCLAAFRARKSLRLSGV